MNATSRAHRPTVLAAIALAVASLLHFTHNAVYLVDYPNLPPTMTRFDVVAGWMGMAAVGALGVGLLHRTNPSAGLGVLSVFALLGLGGLLHYTRAPIADHTIAMKATILLEVAAAIVLLTICVRRIAKLRQRTPDSA